MHKVLLSVLGVLAFVVSGAASAAPTRHPVILVPGIFAFDSIASIDYWYQIPSTLQRQGVEVYVARINAFDNSFNRGEALIRQMESIIAASNGRIRKFNMIGHSQGGVTSRYVMNVRPDLVASVTTMSTPHTGSPVADVVTSVAPPSSIGGIAFTVFVNTVGNLVNLLSNNTRDPASVRNMLAEFTVAGAASFNRMFPAGLPSSTCGAGPSTVTLRGNTIRLYSWGGGATVTTVIDISDPLFAITGLAFYGQPNDGLTGICANHFGQVLRDNYFMNHIDINNHVLGIVSLFETNPKTVFANHANRLQLAGL